MPAGLPGNSSTSTSHDRQGQRHEHRQEHVDHDLDRPTTTSTAPTSTTPSRHRRLDSPPASTPHRTATSRSSARARDRAPGATDIGRPPSSGPLVVGLLVSDVTPLSAGVSPLVRVVPAAVATAPPARQAIRASLLPALAAGFAVLLSCWASEPGASCAVAAAGGRRARTAEILVVITALPVIFALSTNGIDQAIFHVANALEVPVLILALAALALVIFELGSYVVELAAAGAGGSRRSRPAPSRPATHCSRATDPAAAAAVRADPAERRDGGDARLHHRAGG